MKKKEFVTVYSPPLVGGIHIFILPSPGGRGSHLHIPLPWWEGIKGRGYHVI